METTTTCNKFTKSNQSTDKVISILELLSYSPEPMRLIDIANSLNFNTSTALRFLNTLEQNGYVYKDQDSLKYSMTFKLCGLASQITSHTNLVQISSPLMLPLSIDLEECVCLAIPQDYSIIYIHVAEGTSQILRMTQRIGSVAPMHCTGIGKVILSEYREEQIDELIKQKGLPSFTPHTLTTRDALMHELQLIRLRGYGYDNEECEIGARCVSFPIRNYTGQIIAGLSVTGPIGRMTDEFINENVPKIQNTARIISARLGYVSP